MTGGSGWGSGARRPQPGQLRQVRRLRTEATYRVVAVEPDVVLVEVVSGPGLVPGDRFRFSREDVEAMEVLSGPAG